MMGDPQRGWKTARPWLWIIVPVFVIAVVALGTWQLLRSHGPARRPQQADVSPPEAKGDQPEMIEGSAKTALKERALAIARAEVKRRETWQPDLFRARVYQNGWAAVWVVKTRWAGKGGGILHLEIDKDGKIVYYSSEGL